MVRNKVRRLLLDYAAWHFGGGAAGEMGVGRSPNSGPGGYRDTGQDFDECDRARLATSYEDFGHALKLLAYEDREARDVLNKPYLTDPADASVVRLMEARALAANKTSRPTPRQREAKLWVQAHERAVHLLAYYLDGRPLWVRWPARDTDATAAASQRRQDDFYDLVCTYRGEMSRGRAIETAAAEVGYDRSRGYQIVDAREKPASVEIA